MQLEVVVIFQIFYHEDQTCSLHVVGRDGVEDFKDITEAIRTVLALKRHSDESLLTVYNTLGKVVFETFL
jgi:hypothetical protein